MTLADRLISLLGKRAGCDEVKDVIADYNLSDVYNDPPFRFYVGSSSRGVDLLFHSDIVLNVQIYVKPTKTHSAFCEEIPFGIKSGMTKCDITALFFDPYQLNESGRTYILSDGEIKLDVEFDGNDVVRYLSVEKPSQAG
ncbi:hypothetical protein QH494_27530 [Sphingomonas sp. AR_OL41]|uniref:hypothetical protein n=1 Tax=Sphingomonas sp. AR_OL41 TaxID=3042729 RepID=UPI0024811560|nr:hypothetical protein [Sphingomonas sp. AR_OL41]MDH7975948.1 hypothetical protein [Sphingomonas sp. AR_OL41]